MSVQALIGKKIGTTEIFHEGGEVVAVTAVKLGPCFVSQVKTNDVDGYDSVQLGFEEVSSLNNPLSGHLGKSGKLFRYLREVQEEEVGATKVGQEFDVSIFSEGDLVNATGFSKGKGLAGGVKRHGFRGGPKTHGQSDRHRAPGSIGAGSTPGRVIKGLKMAGHLGDSRVTVRNLEVVRSDSEKHVLFVKGSVPGSRNSLVLISKTNRKGHSG